MKQRIYRLLKKVINILFIFCIVFIIYIIIQFLLIANFKVISNSMYPELLKGDQVLVWKPALGPRVFNLLASIKGDQVNIKRFPGFRNVQRNDVLVFNTPYPTWDNWDKIEMHISKYYVKRCIALPGDTLSIVEGIYQIHGSDLLVGNLESQQTIKWFNLSGDQNELFYIHPFDSILKWNIKEAGPMYIPQKDAVMPMTRENYLLYKRLIEWELQEPIYYQNDKVYIRDTVIEEFCFSHNYYFMGGDNSLDSIDSRYWGLVPDVFIVGKAYLIVNSTNPDNGKIRKNRFLKKIT